jgi:hypothetical protein
MAVANQNLTTAKFDVSAGLETGPSVLEVVTNGIASEPIDVDVE